MEAESFSETYAKQLTYAKHKDRKRIIQLAECKVMVPTFLAAVFAEGEVGCEKGRWRVLMYIM
jgi:hypothetical protein